MVVQVCNPITVEAETEDPLGLLAAQCIQSVSSRFIERAVSKHMVGFRMSTLWNGKGVHLPCC